jgi:hypothetical protein
LSTIGLLFSSKDKALVDKLRVHLASLRRQGHDIVETLTYDDIEEVDIILIFLSPYFLDKELLIDLALHAVEQYQRIVPIILRDINEQSVPEPIIKRQCLPRNGKPVVRQDVNQAFNEVHREINKIIGE